jgi:hypothetical protein
MSLAVPSPALPTSTFLNDTTTPAALERRECTLVPDKTDTFNCDMEPPTLGQIVSHLRDPKYNGAATSEARAFFYYGLGDKEEVTGPWMIGWLKSQGVKNYYWAQGAVEPCKVARTPFGATSSCVTQLMRTGFSKQSDWITSNAKTIEEKTGVRNPAGRFAQCYFEALSLAAIHPTAYLFAPEGVGPKATSLWLLIEFGALIKNPNFKELWRVDPRPPKVRGVDPKKCEPPAAKLIWSRARGDGIPKQFITCPWK